MEHAHLHEYQLLTVANLHAVAGFHHVEIPAALAVLSFQTFHAVGGAVNRGVGNLVHERGERAAVVAFAVVGHDEVYLLQVNFFFQILHESETVGCPDGVDEHRFFLFDEVGVLA